MSLAVDCIIVQSGAMSRYSDANAAYAKLGVPMASKAERRARKSASGNADILRLLANMAPMAGTAIGGIAGGVIGAAGAGVPTAGAGAVPGWIAGAGAGSAIGGAAGQAVGSALDSGADSMTKEYEEKQAARDAQLKMLLSALK